MLPESRSASKFHKPDETYRIQLSELVETWELTPVKLSKRPTCPATGGMLSLNCPIPRSKEPALQGMVPVTILLVYKPAHFRC